MALLASCGADQQGAVGNDHARLLANTVAGDDAYETLVQQLYVGYFGRPADPAGLAFFKQAYRNAAAPTTIAGMFDAYAGNAAVRELVDSFAASAESQQLYPACDWVGCDYTWIYALYRSLFSRDPDDEGARFWVEALAAKRATRANVLLSVLSGAQGRDAEIAARKVDMAIRFTRAVDAAGQRAAYSGQFANTIARAMIRNMPGVAEDAVDAAIDASVARLASLAAGTVEEVAPGVRKVLLLASKQRLADNGVRLAALADVLAADLNLVRRDGPTWSVTVTEAAASVAGIRAQLKGYDGAILVGHVPVPSANGAPFLDPYRLPDCPELAVDAYGRIVDASALPSVGLRCRNGLVVSVLRGTSARAEPEEIARKLDQMIAYHKAGNSANGSWAPRFRMIEGGWFGGPAAQWGDVPTEWAGIGLFEAQAISYASQGTSSQRRDAFLDCIGQDNEMCSAQIHGSPQSLMFEGPGVVGEYYSGDVTTWYATALATGSVKAKYVELAACSSQNFLFDDSIGTSLLMRGDALLTHGTVDVTLFSSYYEGDRINNDYFLLANGSTFAETLFGRIEGTPVAIQGDPYITMRPAKTGARPRLVIDGRHYSGGAQAVAVDMPDAAGGASVVRIVTFSNRGDADLHVRIGSMFAVTGVDDGTGTGIVSESGSNALYDTDLMQVFSDGRVVEWPAFVLEQNGGAMPVTLGPGQSVAIAYNIKVRTGADGKPKRAGRYTGQIMVTSDDPGSARIYLEMRGRVR